MLDRRDWAAEAEARAEPGREGVGEDLVAATQAEDVQGVLGETAVPADGRLPDHVEGRYTGGRGGPLAVSPPGVAEAKGGQVEAHQLGQPALGDKINLARIEAEGLQHLAIAQLLAGIPAAVDLPLLVLAAAVAQIGQLELVHVLPVLVVARLGEMFRADVGVEAVGERVVDGADVAAGPARGFQHGDVVAALHQLEGAAQPADAAPGDHDFLRPT
jgi:hypothetical protein